MPLYRYKCFRCGKEHVTGVHYHDVASRNYGACPKCETLITRLNLIAIEEDRYAAFLAELPLHQARVARDEELVAVRGWLARMRAADAYISTCPSSGFGMKPYVGTTALEPAITRLEKDAARAVLAMLRRVDPFTRRLLLLALNNRVIDDKVKAVHPNNRPLLVFRFFNGRRNGLAAACQGSIGHEDCLEDAWVPERARGTTTKQSREHQRGKKKQEKGAHNSDVVSTTCSLRNLVSSSAARYACTPGGQVVPIFFGADHMPQVVRDQYVKMWAPRVALVLIPAGSYVVDWVDFLVVSTSESTSADVSFFEREISYDTHGGQHHLADELIVFTGANPFHGMVQSASGGGLPLGLGRGVKPQLKGGRGGLPFGSGGRGGPPFGRGGPPFGGDPDGGKFFT